MSRQFTERQLIDVIMRDRWMKHFCLPNYTPWDWWECDVFELTPAGFFREYEVKLSVSDFRADRGKSRDKVGTGRWVPVVPGINRFTGQSNYVYEQENKHDLLAKADPRCPSQFYYVTPEGLLNDVTLPPWAGWLEVYPYDPEAKDGSLLMRQRVEAPRIHRLKMKEDPNHFRGTCYFRMHRSGREHAPDSTAPPGEAVA